LIFYILAFIRVGSQCPDKEKGEITPISVIFPKKHGAALTKHPQEGTMSLFLNNKGGNENEKTVVPAAGSGYGSESGCLLRFRFRLQEG
jgi:hypothetical protein